MKLNKVAFAVASVLAIASGYSNAGNIQSSSTTIARDVIKVDTQAVNAPTTTYTFSGDINAQQNGQNFQLQYTLDKGTWAVGTGQVFTASATTIALPTAAGNAMLRVSYLNANGLTPTVANVDANTGLPAGSTVQAFVTADLKTLAFNVSIPSGGSLTAAEQVDSYMKTPAFIINPPVAALNAKVNGLYTVVGPVTCAPFNAAVNVTFAHALSNPGNATIIASSANGSEDKRPAASNVATMLSFVENVKINFTPGTTTSRTSAATLNKTLVDLDTVTAGIQGNYSVTDLTSLVTAAFATGVNGIASTTGGRHYLGKAVISLMANGQDLDYTNVYGGKTVPGTSTSGTATTAGLIDLDPAAAKGATLAITLPTAWPTGTTVYAVDKTGTPITGMSYTTTAAETSIALSAITAAAAEAFMPGNGVYVFADFPGTTTIPNTSPIAVTGTLNKLAAANEQNNVCTGNYATIGGGIKIDVRNYASFATFGATGPATTVRLINNSESNSADVYGQLIYADGTYGQWGKLADLKPREILNMPNKDIEAKLVNAPATANPFSSSTVYTQTPGTVVKGGTKAGMSDRLRIVSTTGTTLRVQSYMVIGSSVIDTSNAQGVDFENSGDRVPSTAVDAQPVSQDAINGLGK